MLNIKKNISVRSRWHEQIEVVADCRDIKCLAKDVIELNKNTNGKVKIFY